MKGLKYLFSTSRSAWMIALFALILTVAATVTSIKYDAEYVSIFYWLLYVGYIIRTEIVGRKELQIKDYMEKYNVSYKYAKSIFK